MGRFGSARPGFVHETLFQDRYCVAARKDHPLVAERLDWEDWRDTGHIFAWSKSEVGADSSEPEAGETVTRLAVVPQWMTALLMAASTDGFVTCPRRLAERHADLLGLQVLDPPFESYEIIISVVRRSGATDAGVDWFIEQIRGAVGANNAR